MAWCNGISHTLYHYYFSSVEQQLFVLFVYCDHNTFHILWIGISTNRWRNVCVGPEEDDLCVLHRSLFFRRSFFCETLWFVDSQYKHAWFCHLYLSAQLLKRGSCYAKDRVFYLLILITHIEVNTRASSSKSQAFSSSMSRRTTSTFATSPASHKHWTRMRVPWSSSPTCQTSSLRSASTKSSTSRREGWIGSYWRSICW